MESVVGIVAFVIALAGLLVALGHVGYLAMLNGAARKRGISGGATSEYVSGRWKVAGGTAAVALLGLLLTSGGLTPDILGLLLAGGAGVALVDGAGEGQREDEDPQVAAAHGAPPAALDADLPQRVDAGARAVEEDAAALLALDERPQAGQEPAQEEALPLVL